MMIRQAFPRQAMAIVAGMVIVGVAACGDSTDSVGEYGNLRYSLYTDYDVPEGELTNARIVTHHKQHLNVTLTKQGRRELGELDSIQHYVQSGAQATLTMDPSPLVDDAYVRGFDIVVAQAGTVVIESKLSSTIVDRLQLQFETPARYELILKVRAPYGDDFLEVDESFGAENQTGINVREGSQITIDKAPLGADGQRLAGVTKTEVSFEPKSSAVPGIGVIESYEDAVWRATGQANFYFVEPGPSTMTVRDPVTGTETKAKFQIDAIGQI